MACFGILLLRLKKKYTYSSLVEYFVSILPFHISPLSCLLVVIFHNIFTYISEPFENSIIRLLTMFKKVS